MMSAHIKLDATNAQYCYIDVDIGHNRSKLANAAAFCDACDTKYGLSTKDLRALGGSELKRLPELIENDHEWQSKPYSITPQLNRIILKLYWEDTPLACENFATLCSNTKLVGNSGKVLSYKGSTIHRIIPSFIVQGGDFVFGNGSGGESIYGKKFKDEKAGLAKKHTKGVLSMGNSGKNSNTSQFFIAFQDAPQCDGKHVVFGEVVSGWKVLEQLEAVGTREGDPQVHVEITECGIWNPESIPASGYWLDQPDTESYSGISPVFVDRPRVAIVAPTQAVGDRFLQVLSDCEVTIFLSDDLKLFEQSWSEKRLDVVLVAPACQSISLSVPFQVAKPVDARQILEL